jgi:tRNA 5-methylaminomethyl-2-thiouridine biosynthesis bifunctional protein
MTPHREYIVPAQLDWQGAQPVSTQFDDIYFSADGEQEVQRIFLQPSKVIERATATERPWFTIAELGFGSGLNFSVSADEIVGKTDKILHFISIEANPLTARDWRKVTALRPHSPTAQALAESPLPLLTGWHRRSIHQGRVQLSVFHGDVEDGLRDLADFQQQPVDAWFLDGFTPTKNPLMWQASVLSGVARLSRRGTTVATFTSAGQIRRDLAELGFAMTKVDQRPFKRTSLFGECVREDKPTDSLLTPPRRINVLGAGIAGASVARELAELGLRVTVYDASGVASGGSKMSVSALHARLLGDESPAAEFRARAFHHAQSVHRNYGAFRRTGALQLALNDQELNKLQRIQAVYRPNDSVDGENDWLSFQHSADLNADSQVEALGGLYFKGAGLVNLPVLCQALLNHSHIELIAEAKEPQENEHWVIACGTNSRDYSLGVPLEIGSVWGQLDWIKPTTAHLPVPIVGNGYAIPGEDAWVVGSSYEYRPWEPAHATAYNINANRRFIGTGDVSRLNYKRAARCVSSDRDPIIGRLSERRWISTAHGSLGTSSAPLAASIIASDIMGWVPPVSARVLAALAPTRFIARQARRGVKVVGPAEP